MANKHEMTKEEKQYISIIDNALDALEESLERNVGRDYSGHFIVPIREALQRLVEDLQK